MPRRTIDILSLVLAAIVVLAGCSERADPIAVTTHPEGYASPNSDVFHGLYVLETGSKGQNCTGCHGEDLNGGTSNVSCYECHEIYPHPDEFSYPSQANFHGKAVQQIAHWDLAECQSCHGSDYAGNGFDQKSCLTCHSEPDGPEDCQTCHGMQSANAGPPTGLGRTTDPNLPAIGAHQLHLTDSTISTIYRLACDNCHVTPATYDTPGHIDDFPAQAEVIFGSLSTQNGRLAPAYDFASNTCDNTYCHGGFVFRLDETENPRGYEDSVIVGNNLTVSWLDTKTTPTDCRTCHSIPPVGHVEAAPTDCWRCHSSVVDPFLNIIDPSRHVNGRPNAFAD